MAEPTVSLSNESRLVDDIEAVFKETSLLAAQIRNFFNTGVGGNPVPQYIQFKKLFDFLFSMSCDHKDVRDNQIIKPILKWRDTPGISLKQIKEGLKLFDEYKTVLFRGQILKYR